MNDPVFLDVEDVLLIHGEQLAKYGGSTGVQAVEPRSWPLRSPAAPHGSAVKHRATLDARGYSRVALTTVASLRSLSGDMPVIRRNIAMNADELP